MTPSTLCFFRRGGNALTVDAGAAEPDPALPSSLEALAALVTDAITTARNAAASMTNLAR